MKPLRPLGLQSSLYLYRLFNTSALCKTFEAQDVQTKPLRQDVALLAFDH